MMTSNGGGTNWLGDAIYFAADRGIAQRAAQDDGRPREAIISAVVNLGRVWNLYAPNRSLDRWRVNAAGYDSVCLTYSGYTQYAVYDPSRVQVWDVWYNPGGGGSAPPPQGGHDDHWVRDRNRTLAAGGVVLAAAAAGCRIA
jgi:hypothetical protein